MSTFGKATFNAASYLSARPRYPESLFEYIQTYFRKHNGGINASKDGRCIDIGCGPGEATLELAKYFDSVTGIDPSPNMIETGTKSAHTYGMSENVRFIVGSDKTFTNLFKKESIDVITSAQAAHWFDFKDFVHSAYKVLKPNGILAVWGYVDHIFVGHPKASELTIEYTYGDKYMGPYWEQPGRNRLREMLIQAEQSLREKFTDVEVFRNSSLELNPGSFYEMSRTLPLSSVHQYMKTASAYHEWKIHHPEEPDVSDLCFDAIKKAENWTDDTEVTIKWATVLLLGTKKN